VQDHYAAEEVNNHPLTESHAFKGEFTRARTRRCTPCLITVADG
jgi:hypothetical protein